MIVATGRRTEGDFELVEAGGGSNRGARACRQSGRPSVLADRLHQVLKRLIGSRLAPVHAEARRYGRQARLVVLDVGKGGVPNGPQTHPSALGKADAVCRHISKVTR